MTKSTDVLVLGAGIIGTAVADELSARGAQVRLLDGREPGQGATQASAGMLAPHTEIRTPASFAALCVEALDRYDAFVARLRRDAEGPFEYSRCGTVETALDDGDVARLRDEAAALAHVPGVAAQWLDAGQARGEEPSLSPSVRGALVVGTHGFVAVSPLVAALVSAARRRGTRVEIGATAHRVVRTPDGVRVHTSVGEHTAGSVVVCAGSWSSRIPIDEGPAMPVRPVRGQLLHLRPRVAFTSRILWGPRCYLVPWADGTLLVGATVEEAGYDERTTAEGIRSLLDAAIELVPALADAELVAARVGLRPATPDGLPVLGAWRDDRRVVVATGHYRNGVLLAPLTAAIVADLVLDGRAHAAIGDLGPDRFVRSLTTRGGGT